MKAINSKKCTPVITLSLCVFIIMVQWSVVVSTAHAQEESSTRIDEIIITAQRRAESIQDVPITLNVYSSEALENLRIDDIDSLARNVPAFTTGMTRTNVPIHTIRGIGFDGVKTSSQSSVGVTMDEVSYTVPFMTKGVMFDLERVEILKGPQGTLFGRNTTAGLVQYIAAKPTDEFEGSVSATIGNYETFNTGGYVSGPLSNTLRGRLAFKKLDSSKGWQKSVTRGDRLGEKDMLSFRGVLEWDATERLQTRLMLNYWRDRSDTVALQLLDFRPGLPPSFPLPSEIFDSTVSGGDNEDADWIPRGHDAKPADLTRFKKDDPRNFDTYFFSPTLYLDYRISDDIAFHSVTAYQRLNRDSFSDYDGTALELQNAEQTAEVRSWQQEFRLSGDYARGNWTAGVYFSDDEMYDSRIAWFGDNPLIEFTRVFGVTVIPQLIDAGVLPGPLPHSIEEISVGMRTADIFGKQERESWAVFFDGNYKVTDGITLTAGIRYSDDRTDFEGCTLDRFNNFAPTHNVSVAFFNGAFPLNVGPGECTNLLTDSEGVTGETGLGVNKVDEDNVSGRLTLDWQLAENVLIYGSVSLGFKSGR